MRSTYLTALDTRNPKNLRTFITILNDRQNHVICNKSVTAVLHGQTIHKHSTFKVEQTTNENKKLYSLSLCNKLTIQFNLIMEQ